MSVLTAVSWTGGTAQHWLHCCLGGQGSQWWRRQWSPSPGSQGTPDTPPTSTPAPVGRVCHSSAREKLKEGKGESKSGVAYVTKFSTPHPHTLYMRSFWHECIYIYITESMRSLLTWALIFTFHAFAIWCSKSALKLPLVAISPSIIGRYWSKEERAMEKETLCLGLICHTALTATRQNGVCLVTQAKSIYVLVHCVV